MYMELPLVSDLVSNVIGLPVIRASQQDRSFYVRNQMQKGLFVNVHTALGT